MYYPETGLRTYTFSQTLVKPPFPLPSPYTLRDKGYTTAEALTLKEISGKEKKERYLRKNLETTVNHLYKDSAVSFTSHYQLNKKGEIVTYPDEVTLHLDPEERGNLYRFGLTSAIAGAIDHPNKVVSYYSPPGPIVFDENPNNKYKDVDPYKIGQLYLMYFDGEKVNNVAIGISKEGENWIKDLMPFEYTTAMEQGDEIAKIKYFITHPVLHGENIDSFLARQKTVDRSIYVNKDRIIFSLDQTLHLIRQSLAGKLPHSDVVDAIMQSVDVDKITRNDIAAIYDQTMILYMQKNNLTSITLGGSCGGKKVSLDVLSGFDMNNLTTEFRMFTQEGIEQLLQTKEEKRPDYHFKLRPNHKCHTCDASGDTTKLGDCDICESCQGKFDSGELT